MDTIFSHLDSQRIKKREEEAAGGNRAGDLAGSFLLRSLVERDQANLAREQQALVQQVLSPEAQSLVVTKEEGDLEEEGYNATEGEICRHEFPSEGRVELPHTQHDYGYSMSSMQEAPLLAGSGSLPAEYQQASQGHGGHRGSNSRTFNCIRSIIENLYHALTAVYVSPKRNWLIVPFVMAVFGVMYFLWE